MRTSAVVLSFAAAALAQSSSSSYSNPNTQYLTETDSRGVATGMPTVVTSQPKADTSVVTSQPTPNLSVVTSQPAVATVPAGMGSSSTLSTSSRSSGQPPYPTGAAHNGVAAASGTGSPAGGNGTMPNGTGSSGSSPTGSSSSGSSSSGSSGSSSGSSGSSSGSSTTPSSSKPSSGASAIQVGTGLLGLTAAAFAYFL